MQDFSTEYPRGANDVAVSIGIDLCALGASDAISNWMFIMYHYVYHIYYYLMIDTFLHDCMNQRRLLYLFSFLFFSMYIYCFELDIPFFTFLPLLS